MRSDVAEFIFLLLAVSSILAVGYFFTLTDFISFHVEMSIVIVLGLIALGISFYLTRENNKMD